MAAIRSGLPRVSAPTEHRSRRSNPDRRPKLFSGWDNKDLRQGGFPRGKAGPALGLFGKSRSFCSGIAVSPQGGPVVSGYEADRASAGLSPSQRRRRVPTACPAVRWVRILPAVRMPALTFLPCAFLGDNCSRGTEERRKRCLTFLPIRARVRGKMAVRRYRVKVRVLKYAAGITVVFVVVLFMFGSIPAGWSDEGQSQCIACHTSPRKLIQITREIAKDPTRQAVVSLETVGEG